MLLNNTNSHQIIVGLDGEMSAPLNQGGKLIQAGFAFNPEPGKISYTSSIIKHETMTWNTDAAEVHKITKTQVEQARTANILDNKFDVLIREMFPKARNRQLLMTGFGVSGFDRPFFDSTLPTTMKHFSRRHLDLSTICLFLSGSTKPGGGGVFNDRSFKAAAKNHARNVLKNHNVYGREHDAGFDAILALVAYDFLSAHLHGVEVTKNWNFEEVTV